MRARDYPNPLPDIPPNLGNVWRYGRPAEWGWECFTCGAMETEHQDAYQATSALLIHVEIAGCEAPT